MLKPRYKEEDFDKVIEVNLKSFGNLEQQFQVGSNGLVRFDINACPNRMINLVC